MIPYRYIDFKIKKRISTKFKYSNLLQILLPLPVLEILTKARVDHLIVVVTNVLIHASIVLGSLLIELRPIQEVSPLFRGQGSWLTQEAWRRDGGSNRVKSPLPFPHCTVYRRENRRGRYCSCRVRRGCGSRGSTRLGSSGSRRVLGWGGRQDRSYRGRPSSGDHVEDWVGLADDSDGDFVSCIQVS